MHKSLLQQRHYRDMIVGAMQSGDTRCIDQLAAQLARTEEARWLLQALMYCPACVEGQASRMRAVTR